MLRYFPDYQLLNDIVSALNRGWYSISEKLKLKIIRNTSRQSFDNLEPKISIITPTYNRAEILKSRALPSVLNQTYKNFEFIIVDDGSHDHTRKVIESFKEPRIRYVRSSRQKYRYPNKALYHWFAGPVVALNVGLELVTGDWIARIDDDDEWTDDHLESLLKHAISGNYEFVSSNLMMIEDGMERIVTPFDDPRDITGIGATQTWLYRSYLSHFKYNIHCWRKRYFRVNDTDLQQRFFDAGVHIGYLPQVTALIRPRPDEQHIGSKAYVGNPDYYERFYSIEDE
jgi:glycosyltransferase involved in cell wall biosynthesis